MDVSLADWRLAASKRIPKCWATLHRNTEWKSGIQRGQEEKATIKRNREKRLKSPERTSKFDVFDVGLFGCFWHPKMRLFLSDRPPIVVKLRVSWASASTAKLKPTETSKNSVLYADILRMTSPHYIPRYPKAVVVGGAISERSTGFCVLKRLAEAA